MGRLDNAKTYNCPLRFTITECEAGWTHLVCDFNGTFLEFHISCVLGNQPSALIEAVQVFHSHEDGYDGLLNVEVDREDNLPDMEGNCWDDAPVNVSFEWEEEPRRDSWKISLVKKELGRADFPLDISISIRDGDETQIYNFEVMFRVLCYAVAKCFTDALKKFGFDGYHYGSYYDDINIRQLLVIKAYALGLLNNHVAREGKPEFRYDFTYEEELQLLMMDM